MDEAPFNLGLGQYLFNVLEQNNEGECNDDDDDDDDDVNDDDELMMTATMMKLT